MTLGLIQWPRCRASTQYDTPRFTCRCHRTVVGSQGRDCVPLLSTRSTKNVLAIHMTCHGVTGVGVYSTYDRGAKGGGAGLCSTIKL